MALTSHVTSAIVRSALSAATNVWRLLIIHSAVNQWSRYKPVRGSWPDGTTGKYGLNLSDWSYQKPRGGAAYSEPFRCGDFRGYEHNKALTDPPVYADLASANVVSGNFLPTTSDYNIIPKSGYWRFGKNTAHDSIRILPSDLGIGSYYWGVKLSSPYPYTNYYKTLGNINDNAIIGFDMKFTNPESVEFVDFPQNDNIGQWDWQLFISSSQALIWTISAPSNIINLPVDADIVRLISSGHFHIIAYLVFGRLAIYPGDYTPITALPYVSGNFPYTAGSMASGYDWGVVNTNSPDPFTVDIAEETWIHYAVYNAANTTRLIDPESWLDGCVLRVWCEENTGASRSPDIFINAVGGGSYGVTINQEGAPPSFNHNPSWSPGWSAGPTADAGFADTQIHITGTPNGFYSGSGNRTMYVWVTKSGVLQGSSMSFGAKDGIPYDHWITGLPPLDGGLYNIYYDSVDRSNE